MQLKIAKIITCLSSIICFSSFILISHFLSSQSTLKDTTIVLSSLSVTFGSALDTLDLDSKKKIDSIQLDDNNILFQLTGHTDSDGTESYNMALSARRVLAVKTYLASYFGIDSSKIITTYKGESQPKYSNKEEYGKRNNRRVTINKIYKTKVRKVTGKITSDTGKPINDGMIFLQSKLYQDSVDADGEGNFSIYAPDTSFIRIDASGRNHFFVSKILKVDPKISRNNLIIQLPSLDINQRYELPEFFFVGDQTILLFRSVSSLNALTSTMKKSEICIIIEGHVNRPNATLQMDETFSYNLSVGRAKAIRDHLVTSGVDSLRINPLGYSNWYMRFPYAKSAREMEENRRVEVLTKSCNDLFEFGQENIIAPPGLNTSKRLHKIEN